ncbi:HNH endonuclease [Pseudonocardia sulfidoxydans NBRC 16205]|uniref:HNH endonuclease n=1 Tax=Pseudonocardia sulfidoxydans NBRC 16205 TaxID=1223511 RepID=A0A511D8N6_9PSEU|nr:HNH endonuclease signature motif containing protein [Pseudonocardia sulfidoxydans]GEL21146.1 HNH endonuclease [Pseudonocardia sulfidoxydans NBRC 16205]
MTAIVDDLSPAESGGLSRARRAERVARIEQLVRLRNSLDAEIAAEVREFALEEVEARLEEVVVAPERVEAGIVAQLGLALRVSPTRARVQLRLARDLRAGLDRVRDAFAAGDLDERKVAAIVAAAAHLGPDQRAEVDRRLSERDLSAFGHRRVADLARSIVAAVAPERFAERARAARADRHVSIRPLEDGMVRLSAVLPVEQGVACYAALRRAVVEHWVDPDPVTRTRGQVMADTLVERLTGLDAAAPVAVEIQVLVPVEALLDPQAPLPAEIPGYGPTDLLDRAVVAGWRRLVTQDGIVVGGDSRRRAFTGVLADLVRIRDRGRCGEVGCDAPIRHLDHVARWSDGGPTSLGNGRGVCVFHNLVREQPGWRVESRGGTRTTTTPSGRRYALRL